MRTCVWSGDMRIQGCMKGMADRKERELVSAQRVELAEPVHHLLAQLP